MKNTAKTLALRWLLVLPALLLGAATTHLSAAEQDKEVEKEKETVVNAGDAAPEFSAKDDKNEEWNSKDHVGKQILVVYFYPADMTGGCTKQACTFRDDMDALKELDVEVVGVSGDTVENHQVFKKAHDLNFTLLADTEGKVAKAFGVPFNDEDSSVTVEIDGKPVTLTRLGTARRWTFVIDQDGQVVYKNDSVNPVEDSAKVQEVVKELKGKSDA